MDPKTVVTLLALNLIAVGGLLHLISRRTADRAGLRGFATGSFVFGMSYLLRLVFGFSSGSAWGIVSDVGMVFATLAFATGLQQFSGRPPFGRRRVVGAVAACAGVALAANLAWPDVGRHAALNLALATAYGLMALLAATGAQREAPPLRPPLRLLALLIGLLAVLTVVRGLAVGDVGLAPLFVGPWAQAYYGYSIVVTMLLGPNLLWMVFVRLNQRLTELATHNPLTRLLNRNGLEEAAQRFFAARPPQAVVVRCWWTWTTSSASTTATATPQAMPCCVVWRRRLQRNCAPVIWSRAGVERSFWSPAPALIWCGPTTWPTGCAVRWKPSSTYDPKAHR